MMMMMESNDVYIALDTAGLARRGAADSDRKWAEKLHILSSSLSLSLGSCLSADEMISPVSGGCQYIARGKWRKQERLWISGHSGLVGW